MLALSPLLIILFFLYLQLPFLPAPTTYFQFYEATVSPIQLIANSILFHNRKVRVIGFLEYDHKHASLYPSQNSYLHALQDQIAVEINALVKENKNMSLNYVIIEGFFDAFCYRYRPLSYSNIHKITRMDLWSYTNDPKRLSRGIRS
ncbi:hypothetical protein BI308_08535 [Roseofilum reptotaenium AO1-A]|uniref:Uncharacterized protein n=1 Tax=Roseofilum reptotaenium AO1-A TaxID=1925591 RepID=A0A1L9QTG7_9CYAN|nr:hypothetical protein BI308_08535 [Roseofilum reptotaenium AO1-A]